MQMIPTAMVGVTVMAMMAGCQSSDLRQGEDATTQPTVSTPDDRLTYQLLSDSNVAFARAFGLVFRVDDPTLEKYQGFGIDLEQASGRTHHMLPVPAVYIADTEGIIRFAHWDAAYKKRLEPETLLKVAGGIRPASQPQGTEEYN